MLVKLSNKENCHNVLFLERSKMTQLGFRPQQCVDRVFHQHGATTHTVETSMIRK